MRIPSVEEWIDQSSSSQTEEIEGLAEEKQPPFVKSSLENLTAGDTSQETKSDENHNQVYKVPEMEGGMEPNCNFRFFLNQNCRGNFIIPCLLLQLN
jgi:hypothetical protein